MRNLPYKRTPKQDLIIKAVFDFCGRGMKKSEVGETKAVALYLMGRKKGLTLDEKQMEDVWCIQQNLKDKTYVQNLLQNPLQNAQISH